MGIMKNGSDPSDQTKELELLAEAYDVYGDANEKYAEFVLRPISEAAEFDGIETSFARSGNQEELRFAISMRNEWVQIILSLNDIIDEMRNMPSEIEHEFISNKLEGQIEYMNKMSENLQRGLKYKDELINLRFESKAIDAGSLKKCSVPKAELLTEARDDVTELEKNLDTVMTMATRNQEKIRGYISARGDYLEALIDDLD